MSRRAGSSASVGWCPSSPPRIGLQNGSDPDPAAAAAGAAS